MCTGCWYTEKDCGLLYTKIILTLILITSYQWRFECVCLFMDWPYSHKGIVHSKIWWKYTQVIQDVDEFAASSEQIWRSVASHHVLTTGSSAVNGCRQNDWVQCICLYYTYICNPPGPHTATTRQSGSRTRDSGVGGGRSNKERQRLQPIASVARAPLFEVRRVRFYTQPLLA